MSMTVDCMSTLYQINARTMTSMMGKNDFLIESGLSLTVSLGLLLLLNVLLLLKDFFFLLEGAKVFLCFLGGVLRTIAIKADGRVHPQASLLRDNPTVALVVSLVFSSFFLPV